MRIYEITDNVVPFPKKENTKSVVPVPQGYDSFYTKKAGATTSHIMGIKPDGSHHQISTANSELANILARAYNQGGSTSVQISPVSMTQAFGSDIEKFFEKLGIQFAEKPNSWEQIQKQSSVSAAELKKAEEALGFLPQVSALQFFMDSSNPHPMSDAKSNLPSTVKLTMPNGATYIADRGGAKSYYRMWLYIRPSSLALLK